MQNSASFEAAVERLRDRFRAEAGSRLDDFLGHMGSVESGKDQTLALEGMINQVHRVRGVAKTFGFAELGQLAEDLENQLDADRKSMLPQEAVGAAKPRIDSFVAMMREIAI